MLKRITLLKNSTALISAAFFMLPTINASANPEGGNVVSGQATITEPDANTLEVHQSTQKATVEWQRFDIAPGETTRFIQPNSDAWTLNRVVGSQDPSRILGTLEANGNVVIVNPDGIHFGVGSRVDVNRLIATTSDISNDNFNAGNFVFDLPGNQAASIVNEGSITAKEYGLSALVAPAVRNSGVITARLGTISLAAGNRFTIDPYGDGLIKLSVDDEITNDIYDVATGQKVTDLVKNDGTLKADGGTVAMTAATARKAVNSVVNNSGVIEANSVGMRGGKIILGGRTSRTKKTNAPVQTVRVSGTIRANRFPEITRVTVPHPSPRKNQIEITGEAILASAATIETNGQDGGGTILIGGDYLGGKADANDITGLNVVLEDRDIPTADWVVLDETTTIAANATVNGNGGKVIVWSDFSTTTAASISANGGASSGDGGFVETSGGHLDVRRAADVSSKNGEAGTWLLDPLDMFIRNVVAHTDVNVANGVLLVPGFTGTQFSPAASPSIVSSTLIETALNAGTNVQVTNRGSVGADAGDVTIEADIRKTAGANNAFFTVNAANDIIINGGVGFSSTSGALSVQLAATDGSITGNNLNPISLNGGSFLMEARDDMIVNSAFDMPDNLIISKVASTSPNGTVDVRFDQDRIRFTHDATTATFASFDTFLQDNTATANAEVHIGNYNVTLNDNAIRVDDNRILTFRYFTGGQTANAVDGNNDIPELISDGTGTIRLFDGNTGNPPANVPTFEAAAVDAPNCVNINCVPPGGIPVAAPPVEGSDDQTVITPGSRIDEDQNSDGEEVQAPSNSRSASLWYGIHDKKSAASLALTYAKLSAAIYEDAVEVDGWKRVASWRDVIRDVYQPKNIIERSMLNIAILAIASSGFNAAVYQRDSEVTLVFEGSRNLIDIASAKSKIGSLVIASDAIMDWLGSNLTQTVGNRRLNQYDFAPMIANYVVGKYGTKNVTVTGHSLGGGLAQYVGLNNQSLNVVSFNSAGFGTDGNSDVRISLQPQLENIVNFRLSEDRLVSGTGRHLGYVNYEYSNLSSVNSHSIFAVIETLEGQ